MYLGTGTGILFNILLFRIQIHQSRIQIHVKRYRYGTLRDPD